MYSHYPLITCLWLASNGSIAAVIWPKYCLYGVKHYITNPFLMKPSVCLYCFTTFMIMMGWKYVHFQSNGFYAHFQENFIFFILYIYAQVCIFSPPLTWLKYCRYGVKLYPINQLYFLSNRSIHLNPRIYPV